MSFGMKGAELDYPEVDKKSYAIFKVFKHFRPYSLKSKTKAIILHPVVGNLLVQRDLGDKRDNWMTYLQEYDLDIRSSKIVRGQGLCKLAAK
jgi:hypothetical protein